MSAGKNGARGTLRSSLTACRRTGWVLAALAAVRAVLLVVLALACRGVLDESGEAFRLWCLTLVLSSAAVPALSGLSAALSGAAGDRGTSELRLALLERLEGRDCEQVNRYHSGRLYSRLTGDCAAACGRYLEVLPGAAGQAVQLAAAFGTLLLLRPWLALALAVCGGGAGLVGLPLRRWLKGKYLAARREEERLSACLQETLSHQELARSAFREGEMRGRLGRCQECWKQANAALRRSSIGSWTGFSLAIYLGMGGAVLWGALAIQAGTLTVGGLTAILQLLNLFRAPVTGLTGVQSRLAAADAAEERLMELWDLPGEPKEPELPKGTVPLALVFQNVTFTYEGEERPVLRNFSARVELNRWTCLLGASGRGKSTLFRLVLGLYHPQEGRILLETRGGGTFPCSAARRLFAFVPQSAALVSGTVRENLLLARPEAGEAELRQALGDAACGFVDELPQGLDTPLGENGAGVSAGQRQRLAIARALLQTDRVLLLDEITSALDHETERRVLENLRRRCPAALISTHRPQVLSELGAEFLNLEGPG